MSCTQLVQLCGIVVPFFARVRTPRVRCAQVIKRRMETLHVCGGNPKHNNHKQKTTPKQAKQPENPQSKPAEYRAVLEGETSETERLSA